jgi:radical SAM superfamily enzyme YgiQ (UPF0313 family)
MYKDSRFSIKSDDIIMADIEFAARNCRRQNRLFLCDGDSLIVPQRRLVPILEAIRTKLPWVERVGTYANTKSIAMKSLEELRDLNRLGLAIAYMGLESGDDVTLEKINKGSDRARMIEMGRKIRTAGIKLSITVILGIAGLQRSQVHAELSGTALSEIDPEYVGALSLMLTSGTPLHEQWEQADFILPGAQEMLAELRTMLHHTELSGGYFHANHASNYLPIKARLPEDKEATLALIDRALKGKIGLKPEYMRGL